MSHFLLNRCIDFFHGAINGIYIIYLAIHWYNYFKTTGAVILSLPASLSDNTHTCSADTGVLRTPFDIFLDQTAWSTIFSPFCLCSLLSGFCWTEVKKQWGQMKNHTNQSEQSWDTGVHLGLLSTARHPHIWAVRSACVCVRSRVGLSPGECLLLGLCAASLTRGG